MKEFFKRLSLPSPEFFKKSMRFLTYIMVTCGGLLVGEEIGGNFLMEWMETAFRLIISFCAGGVLFCKTAVYDWDKKSSDTIDDV